MLFYIISKSLTQRAERYLKFALIDLMKRERKILKIITLQPLLFLNENKSCLFHLAYKGFTVVFAYEKIAYEKISSPLKMLKFISIIGCITFSFITYVCFISMSHNAVCAICDINIKHT